MDAKHMNADWMPNKHQKRRHRYNKIENPMIAITIQDIVVTIFNYMDMFLRIALEHISKETTIDGWVILHALVVSRLVMLAETIQLDHQRRVMEIIKAKKRSMLRRSKWRWTRHGRRRKITTHKV